MRAIVLAGGSGTRLWPLSKEDCPKQFLKIGSGRTLLQRTVDRLAKAPFITEVLVSTNQQHQALVEEQIRKLECPQKIQVLVEPARHNTAPAIALAVKYLEEFCQADPNDPILVLPSDHVIEPESIFFHALEQIAPLAEQQWMVTFGIRPTRAETGYGYIEIGDSNRLGTFKVQRFVEKPSLEVAQTYLEDAHFYWNAGMFLFSAATFWEQAKIHAPFLCASSYKELHDSFDQLPNISIDYAIMERSRELLMCPLAVQWSDIGSWDSVYDILGKDQHQNAFIGQVVAINTKNSLVFGSKRLISTVGLEDMLVVETEEALYIGKKGESQQVKMLVQELLDRGHAMQSSKILEQTDRYIITKISLASQQSISHEGKWISLGKDPIVSAKTLSNPYPEPLELLLVQDVAQTT